MGNLIADDYCSIAATCPPSSDQPGREEARLGGPILIVDADGERRQKWQQSLAESGVFAIATASELKALELLGTGTAFRAAIIGGDGTGAKNSALMRQLAQRRPDLAILAMNDEAPAGDAVSPRPEPTDPLDGNEENDESATPRGR